MSEVEIEMRYAPEAPEVESDDPGMSDEEAEDFASEMNSLAELDLYAFDEIERRMNKKDVHKRYKMTGDYYKGLDRSYAVLLFLPDKKTALDTLTGEVFDLRVVAPYHHCHPQGLVVQEYREESQAREQRELRRRINIRISVTRPDSFLSRGEVEHYRNFGYISDAETNIYARRWNETVRFFSEMKIVNSAVNKEAQALKDLEAEALASLTD